jgi:mycothiol synthase
MLKIVPFVHAHIPTFTAWFNQLPNNDIWTEDWVRSRSIDDESYDPELMICTEEQGEPVGFLLGSSKEQTGWVKAFLVRSDRRRNGIGSAMFRAAEQAFLRHGVQEISVGYAPPKYLLPGVDITYTPAIAFLDSLGYQTSRETRVNMDVVLAGRDLDTSDQETRLQERGITIRRAHPADGLAVAELCETHGFLAWIVETRMGLEKDPPPMFVAVTSGAICGFAAHSVCGPGYFGPMLTSTKLRGHGIGTVLLKRCLRDLQRAGLERCEILWAGPLSFYARSVGATIGRAFWAWHKPLQST